MKSAFSKPGFLANNGTFSSCVRKKIFPMRREGREWEKVATLVQRSKERWFIRRVGEPGLPPCIDSTTGTYLADEPQGPDLGSFTEVTFMWRWTVLRQCLQDACHEKIFFPLSKRGKCMEKRTSFFHSRLPFVAEATFMVHCRKFPVCPVCFPQSLRTHKGQLIRGHNNNGFYSFIAFSFQFRPLE